jgi:hypothetical protein
MATHKYHSKLPASLHIVAINGELLVFRTKKQMLDAGLPNGTPTAEYLRNGAGDVIESRIVPGKPKG